MPKGLLKIKELLIQEDFLLMINSWLQEGHDDICLKYPTPHIDTMCR